ncbi:MAG TPA: YncE family protein [Pseudonocardiaceae bacterium]|nr:YncE family protein [Pseudonocardiaceae bacterium]
MILRLFDPALKSLPGEEAVIGDDVEARRELLRQIRARRASINTYVQEKRPRGHRLANTSIISSAIAAALMAGPAAGGTTFAEAVQKGLSLSQSSIVWQILCLAAATMSIVAAISANLSKSRDPTALIGAAEACNTELEGLGRLAEFSELPVKDAAAIFALLVTKIPGVEEDLSADVNADPNTATNLDRRWRSVTFFLRVIAIVLAGLVLLVTMIGLFIGLGRRGNPPPTSSVTATIPVGIHPVGVAVTPDGAHAYVTNSESNNVSVIDLPSNAVTATIPVGAGTQGVAITPDGRHAYITNRDSNKITVIDTASNTVTTKIPVGADPIWVTISPDGRHAYVLNYDSNNISVLTIGS